MLFLLHGFVWMMILLAGLIVLARKMFANANPEIKAATRKAAAEKATQLINRFLN